MRAVNGRALFAHTDVQLTTFTQAPNQLQIDGGPTAGRLAINGNNFLASFQACGLGHAASLDRANDRTFLLSADHCQHPEKQDG
ncbi:hypothetical protein D3C80_672970 [compost metagenome]